MPDTFLFLLQPAAGLPVMKMSQSLLHCSRNYMWHCCFFSSPAITAEDKKKAQKLALGPPHSPQRRGEKSRDQVSRDLSHAAPVQPFPRSWRPHCIPLKSTQPGCPGHMDALLTTAIVFLTVLKCHQFIPSWLFSLFRHSLPKLSQHPSSLLSLPSPGSCYSSHHPCCSLLPTPLPSKCPNTQTS